MGMREKLIELLDDFAYDLSKYVSQSKYFIVDNHMELADHLIANGVTIQKWIPVTDRLPDNKEHDWVLAQVVEDNGYTHLPKVMEYRQALNDWYEETYGWLSSHNGLFVVTHWMPLPEPPSGERKGDGNG